jgi:hypothetical protein
MKPGGIAKQKSVDSSAGAASLLMGSWRESLRLTLHVSTRKKASLPESPYYVPFLISISSTADCQRPCQGEARRAQTMAKVVPQVMERDIGDLLPLL